MWVKMNKKIRFLTIFTPCENIHLIKDVGMIPYVLYKEYGYDSTIVSYNNGEYSYLETDVKGLKQVFIDRRFKSDFLNSLVFIFFNFRKYDILQVYHFSVKQLFLLCVFKILNFRNKKARVYLKMDVNDSIKLWKFSFIKQIIYNVLLKKIDLLSLESKNLHTYCKKNNMFRGKIQYIPNGFYDNGVRNDVSFNEKENVIITVGRIGTFEKNNEVLLEGFREFCKNNEDWKLEVIGPIEDGFRPYMANFFKTNPSLLNRVVFTGAILDRDILKERYNTAKIFVLSSISEGFPLVFLEAIKSGCNIISTDLNTAYDVTDDGRLGGIFPIGDFMELSRILEEKVSDIEKLSNDCKSIQDFAYEKFSWTKICGTIHCLIQDKLKN
jgi:glycosyltransferase involved in cell wall biosynthesis